MQLKNRIAGYILLTTVLWFQSCGDNEPQKEDVPEMITKVTLTFAPQVGSPVVVTATDPDGEGVQDLVVDGEISLKANMTYVLSIQLVNGLAEPTSDDYDVTGEVEQEGDEHLFFFAWTTGIFSNPAGDGNIDKRSDPVNYTGGSNSVDAGNLPLGLTTTWTTDQVAATGIFHVLLKHQPQLKSATSASDVGETDLDITFNINVR